MRNIAYKKVVSILCIMTVLLGMIAFLPDNAFGATQYVTLDGGSGSYHGGVVLYKNASMTTPYKYTDSNGNQYTGILGKNLYMVYKGTSGTTAYKVQYGNDTAYVERSKTKIVSTLPSSAVQLSSRRQIVVGVHTQFYTPRYTYVVYSNQSTGKVEWEMYCNDLINAGDLDYWVTPPYSYAYLRTMS